MTSEERIREWLKNSTSRYINIEFFNGVYTAYLVDPCNQGSNTNVQSTTWTALTPLIAGAIKEMT